ncbi:MAG: hypothetical protein KW802_01680 [Candidatus Doudnabacteria bacterium]|nr:hypothetical protein [Candidatus Doudnabacteria bacterium]
MEISKDQRRLLESADSDGRVFTPFSREVDDLVRQGYLEKSVYCRGCYIVRKKPPANRK